MTATTSRNGAANDPIRHAAREFARFWPGAGTRNDAAQALAGGLLRAGLSFDDTENFIGPVADCAGDEEVDKRVASVRATAEHSGPDGHGTGWPTLARLLGPRGDEAITRLLADLGLRRKVTLAELAEHKRLPVEFLRSLGLHDLPQGGVGIPYHRADGGIALVKQRFGLQ